MAIRIWPRSLIAQILIGELAAIIVVAVVLPTLMVWLLDAQVTYYQVQILREQAAEIGRVAEPQGDRLVVPLKPELAQTFATPYDGRAYAIVDTRGGIRAESAFAHRIAWAEAPLAIKLMSFRVGPYTGVSAPIERGGHRYWVVVTQDETGRGAIVDDISRAFLTRYAPILLLILLLLPLVNSLLIRRLVVAVRTASARAGTIGPQTLDLRLDERGLPLEIAPLARATNALLLRLEQSFQQQSQFVANVAHELRTPLTTLKFELEAVEDDVVREQLGQTVERLTHVIAQLQALAALEVTAESFASFDVVELARGVVTELAPQIVANGDHVALDAPAQPVIVRANRTLIALALSNLISNATRHTPAGTTVTVGLSKRGLIEVRDDGPGIASSDPQQSRLRYWRADNRRSDSAGLGLSIVTRIMEVHDGELVIESGQGKGARFLLMLPLALLPQAYDVNSA